MFGYLQNKIDLCVRYDVWIFFVKIAFERENDENKF